MMDANKKRRKEIAMGLLPISLGCTVAGIMLSCQARATESLWLCDVAGVLAFAGFLLALVAMILYDLPGRQAGPKERKEDSAGKRRHEGPGTH